MSAAQYWFETPPGTNLFDITEHLRQSFWRYGLGTAWFTATRAEPPYTAEARWNDITFHMEWTPTQYVILKLPRPESQVIDAFSVVLGFKPTFRYTDGEDTVVEWRRVERAARWNQLVERGQPNLTRI